MQSKQHDFVGHHLLASYSECSSTALQDIKGLITAMKVAGKASGATLLDFLVHTFPNGGVTIVMLLSESHASIHTYPEYNACFVDFFTCGNTCIVEKSDVVLQKYLLPQKAHCRVVLRNETAEIQHPSDYPIALAFE